MADKTTPLIDNLNGNLTFQQVSASFFGDLTGRALRSVSSSYASSSLSSSHALVADTSRTASYIGAGTNNYLPKWSSNTLTATSNVIDDGTNIGINTSAPSHRLHLLDNTDNKVLVEGSGNDFIKLKKTSYNTWYLGQSNSGYFSIATSSLSSGSSFLTILNTGYVGINKNAPTMFLDVGGSSGNIAAFGSDTNIGQGSYIELGGRRLLVGYDGASLNGIVQAAAGKGLRFGVNNATFGSGSAMVIDTTGAVGIGTLTPLAKLHLYTGTGTTISASTLGGTGWGAELHNQDSGGNRYVKLAGATYSGLFMNGNVGIATTTPTAQLTVAGDVLVKRSAAAIVLDSGAATDARMEFKYNGVRQALLSVDSQSFNIAGDASTLTKLYNGTYTSQLVLNTDGTVGINTTSNPYQLFVNGDVGVAINKAFTARYDSTELYKGTFRWAGLQLGNNGANRIVAGRTATGGYLSFYTNNTNDASNYTVTPDGNLVMTMLADGKVGIGSATPISQLQVLDFQNTAGGIPTGSTSNFGFNIGASATTITLNSGVDATGATVYSWIQSRNRNSAAYYSLALNPGGGSIGIGTTAPTALLHVFGNVSASSFGSGSFHGLHIGNVVGSASYASSSFNSIQSISSSFASSSNFANIASQSLFSVSSSFASSSNFALLSSQSLLSVSSSFASSSITATNLGLTVYNISVNHASRSFWATSASYASSSLSSSYSIFATNLTGTAYNISVSQASSSVWATSASFASSSVSSSYSVIADSARTASYIGNGTNNYLPKWSSNILTSTSLLYDDGTNVGINTSSPASQLTVVGDLLVKRSAAAIILDSAAATDARMEFKYNGVRQASISVDSQSFNIVGATSTVTKLYNGTYTSQLVLNTDGTVGINTTSNPYNLYVNGDIGVASNKTFTARYDSTELYKGTFRWGGLQLGNNGINRIVAGRTVVGGYFNFYTNNTNDASDQTVTPDGVLAMTIVPSGSVGMGVATPLARLHVATSTGTAITASTGGATGWGAELHNIDNGGNRYVKLAGATYSGLFMNGYVGVGTTTPRSIVNIVTGSGAVARTDLTQDAMYLGLGGPEYNANSYRMIGFGYVTAVTSYFPAMMGYQEIDAAGSTRGDLVFFTRAVNTNTLPSERMRIVGNGNVGIGCTNPSTVLQVHGAISASSFVGNLVGSASYASSSFSSISASYAPFTQAYQANTTSASFASSSISSSYATLAVSASYYPAQVYQVNTISASYASSSLSSSYALKSSNADNATYASTAGVATNTTNINGGAAGDLVYQTGTTSTNFINIGTNGYVLKSNGSIPTWASGSTLTVNHALTAGTADIALVANQASLATIATTSTSSSYSTYALSTKNADTSSLATRALTADNATNATYASTAGVSTYTTNINGGSAGDLVYQSAASSTSVINIGSNGYLLKSNGSIPTWASGSTVSVNHALTAGNATSASYATKALDSDFSALAVSAASATLASHANTAGTATTSSYSLKALIADSAPTSTSASHCILADSAAYASIAAAITGAMNTNATSAYAHKGFVGVPFTNPPWGASGTYYIQVWG